MVAGQNERVTLNGCRTPIVELKNLSKRYGGREIVRDFSLEVFPGEILGFLGPNGAGKTTVIRMMVGLVPPSEGEVFVGGCNIRTQRSQALRHVGVIVENPEMYKYMSGYKNLLHFARMIPGITKQRIQEVTKLVGLEDRIHDKVKTYSLGMRQRLGVAQALLHNPSVLILDEPTNGLDPAGIRDLRDYLKRLARDNGTAVIVSSHMLSEMELMCDRVAIIQQGALLEIQSVTGGQDVNRDRLEMYFEVDRPSDGAEAALRLSPEFVGRIDSNGFTSIVPKDSIPEIAEALVQAGVKIYSISERYTSLEDKFLAATRRNSHHADAFAH